MTIRPRLARAARPAEAVVPRDPRVALRGTELDPALDALRATLAPHRRRLWLRRIVRRTWIAVAAIVVAEAMLEGAREAELALAA